MRTPRALLLLLGSVALVIAAVQGLAGMTELAFYAGPFLLVLGLLLSGRLVGEQAILARRERARTARPAGAPLRRLNAAPNARSLSDDSTRRFRCGPSSASSRRPR